MIINNRKADCLQKLDKTQVLEHETCSLSEQ